MDAKEKHLPGRKPKTDPCRHRYTFNLNEVDNDRFLSLFETSGLANKANFITACIFEKQLKVIKIDKATMDYYMRLTSFYAQFRAIGVNYNQTTRAIKTAFTDKKALAFLYKLEKATLELVTINQQIIHLTEDFEQKWLRK